MEEHKNVLIIRRDDYNKLYFIECEAITESNIELFKHIVSEIQKRIDIIESL